MTTPTPPPQTQTVIINNQIALWTNTLYEAQVQARVAEAIRNDNLATQAAERAEEAIRALDELQKIVKELPPELGFSESR